MHDLGLRDYLQILSRRKWIVIQTIVIVPLAAVAFSLRQSPLYQASSDVLLRYRVAPLDIEWDQRPELVRIFHRSEQIDGHKPSGRCTSGHCKARPRQSLASTGSAPADVGRTRVTEVGRLTDVLRFTSTSADDRAAAAIATEYARQFTIYYKQLDTQSISGAIAGLQQRIAELRAERTHGGNG